MFAIAFPESDHEAGDGDPCRLSGPPLREAGLGKLPLQNPTDGSTALDGNDVALVQLFVSQIAPDLRSCASPGWYAEASDGPAISAALKKMFDQTAKQATLTY